MDRLGLGVDSLTLPGGLSEFCDDCGWQACFKGPGCLQARAAQLGVEPQDLIDGVVVAGVDLSARPDAVVVAARNLTPEELEQLAAELPRGALILNNTVARHD